MKKRIVFISLIVLLGSSLMLRFNRAFASSSDSSLNSVQITESSEPGDTTIIVKSVGELFSANGLARQNGHVTILLKDGVYQFTRTLTIIGPFVTIKSESGIRENVIIEGDKMAANAKVKILIRVEANDFKLADLTLRNCGAHLLQIAGEKDADRPIVDNVIFRDGYEQLMKVTYSLQVPGVSSNSGIVRNCLFEYTAGIGPQYYIGGIDCHLGKYWIVQNNKFRNIISPSSTLAEHAIHFWSDSEGTIVEGNVIVDCDRGIGFGLGDRGHIGGIIRNNIVYNTGRLPHDVGIGVESCADVQIYNNTVFMKGDYPNSIELRWEVSTNGKIYNNLCNGEIDLRNNSSADLQNNIKNADSTMFVSALDTNFHLLPTAVSAINAGITIDTVLYDFDQQKRPWGAAYDIGADEYNGIIFYSNSYLINKGESLTLNWSTNNLDKITAYGAWTGTLENMGSKVVTPDSSTVYGIYGVSGSDTARFLLSISVIPELAKETGVSLSSLQKLNTYPNPGSDFIFIELPEFKRVNENELVFKLFNTMGQKLNVPYTHVGDKLILNTSSTPSGQYIFIMEAKKGFIGAGKIVVKNQK